ncbi:MAG: hypothetical protein DMG96_34535, partial [Acidobacteria bacterium]
SHGDLRKIAANSISGLDEGGPKPWRLLLSVGQSGSNLPGRKTSLQEDEAPAFENRVSSTHAATARVTARNQPFTVLTGREFSAR